MELAYAGANIFSTCAKRQYFSVIISSDGRVAGTGYNGGPSGTTHCVDGGCPRYEEQSDSGTTYDNCIAIHSEANAIMFSNYRDREGASLYVNGSPCFSCAKLIANSGIKTVYFISDSSYKQEEDVILFLINSKVKPINLGEHFASR